jgi:predicted RNA-binding protein with PUA-like domain
MWGLLPAGGARYHHGVMWLLKTEPSTYGYDDLERDGQTRWDGVTNPVALRNLRAMKVGDAVAVYHTGDEKAVVGTALVVKEAYPDPKAKNPRLVVVDIRSVGRAKRPVTLAEIKALPVFAESPLVRQGRLSVVPLTKEQWNALAELAERRKDDR